MTLREYYAAVRPFYGAEMALRTDVPEWLALARRLGARRVLDLGCGGGRIGVALKRDDPARTVIGIDLLDVLGPPAIPFARADMRALPLADASFDLVVAANDPFAHVLDPGDRAKALREARRAGGRVVVDGTWAHARGDFERSRDLAGVILTETWRRVDDLTYDTRFTYRRGDEVLADARTRVRSWHPDEPAIRAVGARVAGGLDGRPFDPQGDRIVIFA